MKIKRQPRKLIKLSEAMEILPKSRGTLRNMIEAGELTPAPVPRRGPTSPIMLYEAQVIAKAKEWGIF